VCHDCDAIGTLETSAEPAVPPSQESRKLRRAAARDKTIDHRMMVNLAR